MNLNCFRLFFAIFFSFATYSMVGGICAFGFSIASDSSSLTNRSQIIFNSENGMPVDEVNDVLQTGDGYIWIASDGGLLRYDGGEFKRFALKESDKEESFSGIHALYQDDGGRLWIGTEDQGVYYCQDGIFTKCQVQEQNRFYSIDCFRQGSDGTMYMGTSGGLARITDAGVLEGLNTKELLNQGIESLSFDKNDVLWGTTSMGYAFALKGEPLLYWFAPGTLHEDENTVVMAEGNCIYIGTGKNHLIRLILQDDQYDENSYNKTVYNTGNLRTIHCLLRSREGELWLGSETGYGWFSRTMELNSSRIPESEEVLSIGKKDGLLSDRVRCVLELKDGRMAVGTDKGLNLLRQMQVVESYGENKGLLNTAILCLLEEADGSLLAGSDGSGIYRISPYGKMDVIDRKDGLDSGVVLRMREDEKNGGVWISAGNSLFFMERDGDVRRIEILNVDEGGILDLFVIEEKLLMIKHNSIVTVPLEDLLEDKAISISEYSLNRGFTGKMMKHAWNLYDDGILYLCTTEGVFLLNTEDFYSNIYAPKMAVSEIIVTREDLSTVTIENPKEAVLPKDTKRITIRFACLSFDGMDCTVEYYLEGFNDQPVRISSRDANTVSYTNLPGGAYVFHLSAMNSDGVHSGEEALVTIEKKLHFSERCWFWIIAVLGIILFAWAALRRKYQKMKNRQQEYRAIVQDALTTIANTIDAKDPYTKGHSLRVARYSGEIARRLGFSEMEQERIYYVGLMHDIGKIGIPDAILNKRGTLTGEEYEIMKKHAFIGEEILRNFRTVPDVGQGAASHHERYDGLGYPEGLSGEMIPLVGRIICVADSVDAMVTKRAYRKPMDREYVLSELRKGMGKQFDPTIARIMMGMIEEGFILWEKEEGQ